jgi:hypothetical protein
LDLNEANAAEQQQDPRSDIAGCEPAQKQL